VVTLPLFLAALAFAFEFGNLFLAHLGTVKNVRAAARYLSRVPITTANIKNAADLVCSGDIDGNCNGDAPEYLRGRCGTAEPGCITTTGDRIQIRVRGEYSLTLFNLVGGQARTTIPFVVTETTRHVGM
jgi:hypothetical protein